MKIRFFSGLGRSPVKSLVSVYCVCLICCGLLLVSCRSSSIAPQGITVKIERVVSGQTLEILGQNTQDQLFEKVRLIGIDAPDLKQQPWGLEAKEQLENMINNEPVLLETDLETKDRYGRLMAYMWRKDLLLNEQLIAEGYALYVPRSPNNKYNQRFARAQEKARILGLGIWNPKQPMRLTPAEFRQQYR